jgi:hypothetical protein
MLDSNILSSYRRAIARRGISVTFQRVTGQAPNVVTTTAMVDAIVMNYQVEPGVMNIAPEGGVSLGDRMIIAIQDDLRLQQFPLPVRKNDKVLVNGEWLNVETIDPNKRELAGAIEVHARGSK